MCNVGCGPAGPRRTVAGMRRIAPLLLLVVVGDVERRDRYGRLLAYVYREPDGAFVNARLVRDGYARPLTIAPNVAHARELADLAREARRDRRGLWNAC